MRYLEILGRSAIGTLRGFDRHMNLILQDVEEKYTVRLRIERSKHVPQLLDLQSESDGQQGTYTPFHLLFFEFSALSPLYSSSAAVGKLMQFYCQGGQNLHCLYSYSIKHQSRSCSRLKFLLPAGPLLQAYIMKEVTRSAYKLEHRERKLKQIFVRGSNIVMITTSWEITNVWQWLWQRSEALILRGCIITKFIFELPDTVDRE